jgi:hypothetical protein
MWKLFCNYLLKLLKILANFTTPNANDMAAFTIELQRAQDYLIIVAQKLDPWPDNDGYERYELTTRDGGSVISLDADHWAKPYMVTPEDAEDHYEMIHYPSQRPFFSNNNVFTNAELRKIAGEIAKHTAYANQ